MKKETRALEFFCEFCEISKNTFFYRIPLVAASNTCRIKCLFIFVPYISAVQLYLKRGSGTVVFCEFCGISKNSFSYGTFPVAASVNKILQNANWILLLTFD